jgi:CxxC motif-containing protein (DUF1111 family)
MKRLYPALYVVLALLAATPLAVRAFTWRWRPHPALDPDMARAGETLFKHDWTPNDPLARGGDGLGPVYNATSCVACHNQGGTGGAGGVQHNVTTFTIRPELARGRPREGVVHAHAVKFQETLASVDPSLPAISQPTLAQLVGSPNFGGDRPLSPRSHELLEMPSGVHLSQRNTPALFGDRLIDQIPDEEIIANERRERLKWGLAPADGEEQPVGRALRRPGGRVGHFGWKAQSSSLSDFVTAACANELGLGNPGQAQPRPLGAPGYQPPGLDLTAEQCDQITAFVASLPRPEERLPERPAIRDDAPAGKKLFTEVGCADCHTPDVGSVEGIYSDLLLHRMGEPLEGGGSYNDPPPGCHPPRPAPPGPDPSPGDGPTPGEWRTPPLWGVADSAPYLHDGRAATLEEAILLHGGQAARSARRFQGLTPADQTRLVAFLKTLRAP